MRMKKWIPSLAALALVLSLTLPQIEPMTVSAASGGWVLESGATVISDSSVSINPGADGEKTARYEGQVLPDAFTAGARIKPDNSTMAGSHLGFYLYDNTGALKAAFKFGYYINEPGVPPAIYNVKNEGVWQNSDSGLIEKSGSQADTETWMGLTGREFYVEIQRKVGDRKLYATIKDADGTILTSFASAEMDKGVLESVKYMGFMANIRAAELNNIYGINPALKPPSTSANTNTTTAPTESGGWVLESGATVISDSSVSINPGADGEKTARYVGHELPEAFTVGVRIKPDNSTKGGSHLGFYLYDDTGKMTIAFKFGYFINEPDVPPAVYNVKNEGVWQNSDSGLIDKSGSQADTETWLGLSDREFDIEIQRNVGDRKLYVTIKDTNDIIMAIFASAELDEGVLESVKYMGFMANIRAAEFNNIYGINPDIKAPTTTSTTTTSTNPNSRTTTSQNSDNNDSAGGVNPFVIVGICIVGIAIACTVYFVIRGKKGKKEEDSSKKDEDEDEEEDEDSSKKEDISNE